MNTIYADVLIILNIYVNFFLLRTTARITHTPLKFGRCAFASAYGSIFSLMILLPELPYAVNLTVKAAAAVTVVVAAFGFKGVRRTFINTAAFFTSNLILGGTVYAVCSWLRPDFIRFRNTYFYIDFSLLILILTTAAMYGIVFVLNIMLNTDCSDKYNVIIRYGKKITKIQGLADTGNVLIDFFTGSPVIICDKRRFSEITGVSYNRDNIPKGFRLLPCTTVSGSSFIMVFRPDEVMIEKAENGSVKTVDALIGFGKTFGDAVFNPKLLNN